MIGLQHRPVPDGRLRFGSHVPDQGGGGRDSRPGTDLRRRAHNQLRPRTARWNHDHQMTVRTGCRPVVIQPPMPGSVQHAVAGMRNRIDANRPQRTFEQAEHQLLIRAVQPKPVSMQVQKARRQLLDRQ
jgi:hypothetical protein